MSNLVSILNGQNNYLLHKIVVLHPSLMINMVTEEIKDTRSQFPQC